jgi:hypothetical protein
MDIKLISTISDIDKFIKIVEITNYIEYIPNKKDFVTKSKKIYGKNDIYKIEYFIEKYNYTFDYIIINETIFNNKTGKNETKLINKSIIKDINSFWVEFKPYDKIMFKNETFKLKIIHYKKPELGFFKIQTIPIFKNVECKEFTWWLGNWNLKRPILINNTYGDNVTNYQLKSINLSEYEINASSTRIINESSGLIQNHWNETIDNNGNLEYVWCNYSKMNNGSWINNTYYIYYQSNPLVNTISNGTLTFLFFDDFLGSSINNLKWNINGNPIVSNGNLICTDTADEYVKTKNTYQYKATRAKLDYITEMPGRETTYGFTTSILPTNPSEIFFYRTTGYNIYSMDSTNTESITATLPGIGYKIYDIHWLNDAANFYGNDGVLMYSAVSYYADSPLPILIGNRYADGEIKVDWILIRKYTINEPELWTVGNIEYPEDLNMTCNLKIITHLTNKKVQIIDMNASIVNESYTNECINLSYDSYIVYMSNPVFNFFYLFF